MALRIQNIIVVFSTTCNLLKYWFDILLIDDYYNFSVIRLNAYTKLLHLGPFKIIYDVFKRLM